MFPTPQVLELLQADVAMRQAAAAAGPLPAGNPGAGGSGGAGPSCSASSSAAAAAAVPMAVELEGSPAAFADQLSAEVEDLKAEMVVAHREKKVLEEQYLAQIIAVSVVLVMLYVICYITRTSTACQVWLRGEMVVAHKAKKVLEEQFLALIIAVSVVYVFATIYYTVSCASVVWMMGSNGGLLKAEMVVAHKE
jgi:hypothetical protein